MYVYMAGMKNACEGLMKKPYWKRPLRRHRCNWKDTIKMSLREPDCGLGSSCSRQCDCGSEPSGSIKGGILWSAEKFLNFYRISYLDNYIAIHVVKWYWHEDFNLIKFWSFHLEILIIIALSQLSLQNW
jgi:hypothetical protein